MNDPFFLDRFVSAQAPIFEDALAELRGGRKRTHWMWFVFPQLAGLGHSPMAKRYAIGSLDEARAYLAHEVLGPRLIRCTDAVLAHADASLGAIFGSPDDRKFGSSMTLFALVDDDGPFRRALDTFCAGRFDPATMTLLRAAQDDRDSGVDAEQLTRDRLV